VFSPLHHPRLRRFLPLFVLMFVIVLVAPRLLRNTVARASAAESHAAQVSAGMNMSDDEMRAMAQKYAATHPQHVSAPLRLSSTQAAPADSFLASNFIFQEDGNAGTQVDTAHIQAGQSIRFKWVAGFHTATSGTGSSDPNMGVLFNHNLFSAADNFNVTFPDPGTFPFFCTFHEASDMKGVVVVSAPASVPPAHAANVGFVSALTPNPTTRGVSFRFALAQPGRARVDVFDAQGRRVATPIDADYEPGTFAGAWNGLDARGVRVNAGVYTVRLRAPGIDQSRQLAYTR